MPKERLDVLIFKKGLAESREKAAGLIMSGNIFVKGIRADKAGNKYDIDTEFEVKGQTLAYVSRGGLKLEKALKKFKIDLNGKICMDVGASTGGFTDCMLQNGAKKVFSVDVGYGQLAWKLRTDERVVNLERTNVRYLTHEAVPELVDFISIDVAFISLKLVLPKLMEFVHEDSIIMCLIKPQFEAGKEKVGKKGVVRDISVHEEVVLDISRFTKELLQLNRLGIDYSPIKGPEGNIEYLLLIGINGIEDENFESLCVEAISKSHEIL